MGGLYFEWAEKVEKAWVENTCLARRTDRDLTDSAQARASASVVLGIGICLQSIELGN